MQETINSTLKKPSRLPLSLKVKYTLRARMEKGEWPVGTQLPTLPQLVDQYGVSRATIRTALDELEREGLIERTRGRGTFVIADISKQHWLMLPSDWNALIAQIEQLHVQFHYLGDGTSALPSDLNDGTAADTYWWTSRINVRDGLPYSFNTAYVAQSLYEAHRDEFEKEAVLTVLQRHFADQLSSARQVLTIQSSDAVVAGHLQMDIGTPLIKAIRIAKDPDGRILYAAQLHYRASCVYIEQDIKMS